MERNARTALVAVLAGAAVLALVAFAAGAAVVGSESTVESTVVTTQVGNVTAPGGGLTVAVRGDGRFADRVADRLATRLTDDGYEITRVTAVGDVDDGPALVVSVEDAAVDPGFFRRSADLTVTSYYATDWNATTFDGYEETGAVALAEPGQAVVGGEYRIRDESRGLTGNYRGQLVGQVVDAVAESFRGAVPR